MRVSEVMGEGIWRKHAKPKPLPIPKPAKPKPRKRSKPSKPKPFNKAKPDNLS